jgi:foldase protein PrsA
MGRNSKLLWGLIGCLLLLCAVLGWNLNEQLGARTVAKVGEEVITFAEFNRELKQTYGQHVLDKMIDKKAVFLQAKELGLEVSEAEIKREMEKLNGQMNPTGGVSIIGAGHKSQQVKEDLTYYLLLEKLAIVDIEISDEQAQEYFKKNPSRYNLPPMARISAIYLDTEAEAKQVVAELKRGADFHTLAKERSADIYSSANGGDLGWVTLQRERLDVDESILTTAQTLQTGVVSSPVALEKGFAVIKVEEKKDSLVHSFTQVKEEIKRDLALQQAGSLADVLKRLKAGLKVEVLPF